MNDGSSGPRLVVTYCTQCRWLLRATWIASELLTTFATDIGELALRPGTGGVFTISVDDEIIWDRTVDGGFPDASLIKRLVRDRIAPERNLGHTDRALVRRQEPPASPPST
jgi:selenoprotein W-related protein